MATVNGTAGADSLAGTAADDTVNAFGGNDSINLRLAPGGADLVYAGDGADIVSPEGLQPGADTIYLEGGNDQYAVRNPAGPNQSLGSTSGTIVYGGLGNDQISLSTTTGGSLTGYGGAGADFFNPAQGNIAMYGGSGDDVWEYSRGFEGDFNGRSGSHTIDGGSGKDQVRFWDPGIGGTTSNVVFTSGVGGTFTYTGKQTGTFTSIENIQTADGDDTINAASATIDLTIGSRFGADTVSTGSGNDTIDAGGSNDSVNSGAGNDIIYGGGGDDIVLGGSGNDALYGGADADSVNGGSGDDTIFGDLGADTLVGGSGVDLATYAASGSAVTVSLAGGLGTGGDAAGDTLSGIENLTGSAFADSLTGGGGANVIDGGAGNDTLVGGGGADTLTGGIGSDLFVWDGTSNDVITDFGVGNTGGIGDPVLVYDGTNDFVDLSGIFNPGSLAAYNLANGTTFVHPIAALNHDVADGVINFNGTNLLGPTLTLTGITGNLTGDQTAVVCFARGTLIKTIKGELPIEALKQGDRVLTLDAGYQPIQWIGSRKLDAIDLGMNPKLKPIRIRVGALGDGFPEIDLLVSPQHRVLVRSSVAERMFGEREVLIPANKLVTIDGIDIEWDAQGVEYFHMLFEDHQIVFSNGAPTESLFTGPEALKAVSPEARAEIVALFPQIASPDFMPEPVRFIPEKGKHMKVLAQRLAKNGKPAFELNS